MVYKHVLEHIVDPLFKWASKFLPGVGEVVQALKMIFSAAGCFLAMRSLFRKLKAAGFFRSLKVATGDQGDAENEIKRLEEKIVQIDKKIKYDFGGNEKNPKAITLVKEKERLNKQIADLKNKIKSMDIKDKEYEEKKKAGYFKSTKT
jgi:hypothetical protein